MEYSSFVRKPFIVQAVQVTNENIEEIAELIGKLKTKDDGSKYIAVNRRLIPTVVNVYTGYWVTQIDENNIRCYSNRIFRSQFCENTTEIQNWVDFLNDKKNTGTEIEAATTG